MAFWFGITSMIRPAGLERIPSSFILASMKQGLSAATPQPHTQHTCIERTPRRYPYHPRSSEPIGPCTPNFGGTGTLYNTTPRDQYLFLKYSDERGHASVSRAIEREGDSSTYCITGTTYVWMPASAHRPDHKWKRS